MRYARDIRCALRQHAMLMRLLDMRCFVTGHIIRCHFAAHCRVSIATLPSLLPYAASRRACRVRAHCAHKRDDTIRDHAMPLRRRRLIDA